jgi:hypothetical protein
MLARLGQIKKKRQMFDISARQQVATLNLKIARQTFSTPNKQ